jgi:hypothetical protein
MTFISCVSVFHKCSVCLLTKSNSNDYDNIKVLCLDPVHVIITIGFSQVRSQYNLHRHTLFEEGMLLSITVVYVIFYKIQLDSCKLFVMIFHDVYDDSHIQVHLWGRGL